MELTITTKRVVRVWWSYFWRNVLGIFLVSILAPLFGILSGIAGVDPHTQSARILITALAVVMALATTLIPIQMILGRDFGDFRLVLLGKELTANRTEPVALTSTPATNPTGQP